MKFTLFLLKLLQYILTTALGLALSVAVLALARAIWALSGIVVRGIAPLWEVAPR